MATTIPESVTGYDHAHRVNGLLEIEHDVAALQLSIVNVVFVGEPSAGDRSWVLVDTGLSYAKNEIVAYAQRRFGAGARPAAIILTHGHFDHVGTVQKLCREWDCPVYAHHLEMPYLTGKSSYPPADPSVGGGAMAMMASLYPHGPIDLGDRVHVLPEDYTVPGMPGWRWIATPGHSPGHISLYRESDGCLIAGDAFVTTKQESLMAALLQPRHVHAPPAYFTPDWASAAHSVRKLANLQPKVAITGHGKPMFGDELRRELDDLADHFDANRPHYGRYVAQAAETNETGVVAVPPRVVNRQLMALGAGVGAAMLGAVALRRRSAKHQQTN